MKGLVMHPPGTSWTLDACSICLRVLRRGEWIPAETFIVEERSFERGVPPRFAPVVCAACERSIQGRRVQPIERLAA
jgi:hypothetical protein